MQNLPPEGSMSSNNLAVYGSNGGGVGSREREHRRRRNLGTGAGTIPRPLYDRQVVIEGGNFSPWRLFEERVRTGPYSLSRFPSQPYSPFRILIIDGGGVGGRNTGLRQFIGDSPPPIRGEWRTALALEAPPAPTALTDEEFKKVMNKMKKEVYNRPPRDHGGASAADAGKECSVCLEVFKDREKVLVTPCNHMFHHDCLAPWIKSHGRCPVCRFSLLQQSERSTTAAAAAAANFQEVNEDMAALDLMALVMAMEEAFNWLSRY